MSEFNQELLLALANGDEKAHDSIRDLPIPVRMAIGLEVDKLRREKNIVPMDNGFSIYEKKASKYSDDDQVAKALANRLQQQRENEERQEKIRQEWLEEQTKAMVERARAGLTINDRR